MKIQFSKMHGSGNDFMVIDGVNQHFTLLPERVSQLGNRRKGVGFDQLLVVEYCPEENIDFIYRIYNNNGSEAKHCGNGARCIAKFIWDLRLSHKNILKLSTPSGVIVVRRNSEEKNVSVNMGKTYLDAIDVPTTLKPKDTDCGIEYETTLEDGIKLEFTTLSMGNPHAIFDVDDLGTAPVKEVGSALQDHNAFPDQVNVSFADYVSPTEVHMRVYERGAGETLSCGSAACATVVSGILRGKLEPTDSEQFVQVTFPGGELFVQWIQEKGIVVLKGEARTSFRGQLFL